MSSRQTVPGRGGEAARTMRGCSVARDFHGKREDSSAIRTGRRAHTDDDHGMLRLAQDTAKNAKDPELKAMAQKAAPDIEKHLQEAKELSDRASAGASKPGASK